MTLDRFFQRASYIAREPKVQGRGQSEHLVSGSDEVYAQVLIITALDLTVRYGEKESLISE